ncbi:phosphate ABC transporter permease PstA [Tichowtungia aerotolerans]|uniref:Phosphate transport system permease protein PstA n=1 Tax=Tichowtungia aerotolerans TaxID=2697043 RepID=A0A6P1M964_9BACT|nr:phosphate ABC transporter permease PstA [Tichowtungia aerotolerans]QHI70431.1 phosphate ABC transporter permease PstA [Tichowtungia aerotolerans]
MRLETRKLLDRAFSGAGLIAIGVMALVLVIILAPIVSKGTGAFVFRGTIEHRKVMFDQWGRGNPEKFDAEKEEVSAARQPVYDMLSRFEADLDEMPRSDRRPYKKPFRELEKALAGLLGPAPGERTPVLIRQQYGATRWDRAQIKLDEVLYTQDWDYSNPDALGVLVKTPRKEAFENTSLEPLFGYLEEHVEEMLRPRMTFYWQFLTDTSKDSHIFGGIGPEVLGTIYLTIGAMIFAIPMGVIAAIYLCEYAKEGRVIGFLRTCISTLAGVPSIVFGLFGLAFFLNTIHVSDSKSVLAGSLTLSLLILPTVIRASEESILSVPKAYKEAALSLGAGRWHTVLTVILPAALPGILTGVVISMGRAAGETAPIIFTAAVSVGRPLLPSQALSQPTPALPWNIYNLCTEHEAVDEIRHVQYGMVFTLVALVLLLNVFAIVMRAKISKKLRG